MLPIETYIYISFLENSEYPKFCFRYITAMIFMIFWNIICFLLLYITTSYLLRYLYQAWQMSGHAYVGYQSFSDLFDLIVKLFR